MRSATPDTGRVAWSDEYYRILGLSTDATPSRGRALSMVHAEDIAGVRTAWAASMEHGTPADQFMRIRRADGVERWVRVRTVPDLAADGAAKRAAHLIGRDHAAQAPVRVHRHQRSEPAEGVVAE